MDSTKQIKINLADSTYAHGFKPECRIHADELERCLKIIEKQIGSTVKTKLSHGCEEYGSDIFLTHKYDTIGIFGERGSGKTSFMISLLESCRDKFPKAAILRMIDPTLVEHKKPIVLSVIAHINNMVEDKLRSRECTQDVNVAANRKEWEKIMKSVAEGVPAVDEVGQGYKDRLWDDSDFVIHRGFDNVNSANNFECSIRKMLRLALSILDKEVFILPFDDIDVDVKQGWEVLESIRRYFSNRWMITIVTGNIHLYGMIVRAKLAGDLSIQDNLKREAMANELESQYMLKLLSPENRINLLSLKALIQKGVNIRFEAEGKEDSPDGVYKQILERFGIKDWSTQKTFTDFLETMSLRSQIHFAKEAWNKADDELSGLSVFSSRMYAVGINMDELQYNPGIINMVILKYLLDIRNLSEAYLLLPISADKDTNSHFTAFTMIECNHFKSNPYLMLDYMLRVAYVRNATLPMSLSSKVNDFVRYAGWSQAIPMRNSVGLSMAFLSSLQRDRLAGEIPLYGLYSVGKKENKDDALDVLLRDKAKDQPLQQLLAVFPYINIINRGNNESRSYYSLFALLGVICEILTCESEEEMKSCINNLRIFRSYPAPAESETQGEERSMELDLTMSQDSIDTLAHLMYEWKKAYKGSSVPPYTLGRIITRVYNAIQKVEGTKVGERMNLMVSCLINACIIEECRLRIDPGQQGKINNNNPETSTKIVIDNLKKDDIINQLDFSKWIMNCPMLICFLDEAMLTEIKNYPVGEALPGNGNVNKLLTEIDVNVPKTSGGSSVKKPNFSGSKKDWEKSRDLLLSHGSTEEDIKKKIIDAADAIAQGYIEKTGIFNNVPINSVRGFRKNYKA